MTYKQIMIMIYNDDDMIWYFNHGWYIVITSLDLIWYDMIWFMIYMWYYQAYLHNIYIYIYTRISYIYIIFVYVVLCYLFISCVYILYIRCELHVSQAKCALVQEQNSSLFGHSWSCPIYPPPAQLHPPSLRTPRPFNIGDVFFMGYPLTNIPSGNLT